MGEMKPMVGVSVRAYLDNIDYPWLQYGFTGGRCEVDEVDDGLRMLHAVAAAVKSTMLMGF